MKYFTSDWHLSHKLMLSLRKEFKTLDEMDKTIIDNMLTILNPGDELYFIGDLSWNINTAQYFFNLLPKNNNFHWILGNHDYKIINRFKNRCKSVAYMKEIKINKHPVILCHYPMLTWSKSHYNSWLLFGHHHNQENKNIDLLNKTKGKMLNVNLEFHNYKPLSENDIIKIMETKKDNWDIIKGKEL